MGLQCWLPFLISLNIFFYQRSEIADQIKHTYLQYLSFKVTLSDVFFFFKQILCININLIIHFWWGFDQRVVQFHKPKLDMTVLIFTLVCYASTHWVGEALCFRVVRPSVRPVLWTRYLKSWWTDFDQTLCTYSLPPSNELIRFSRSRVKGQSCYGKFVRNLVNMILQEPVNRFSSNLAHILPTTLQWTD